MEANPQVGEAGVEVDIPEIELDYVILPPRTHLMTPYRAPEAMLSKVEVDSERGSVFVEVEGIGRIDLALYYQEPGSEDDTKAHFLSPIREDEVDFVEPETLANAPLLAQYPYAVIPDQSELALVAHAPEGAVDGNFGKPEDTPLGGWGAIRSSYVIERQFPELTGQLSGDYQVYVKQRVLNSLSMGIRFDNGDPQIVQQVIKYIDLGEKEKRLFIPAKSKLVDVEVAGDAVVETKGEADAEAEQEPKPVMGMQADYSEMMTRFVSREQFPDVVTAAGTSKITHMEAAEGSDEHEITQQPWVFVMPDGFQRTDTEGLSGLAEIIVFRTQQVVYSELKLEPYTYTPPPMPDFGDLLGGLSKGSSPLSFGSTMRSGLSAGEVRLRAPVTLKGKSTPVVNKAEAVAAFRVALTGEL